MDVKWARGCVSSMNWGILVGFMIVLVWRAKAKSIRNAENAGPAE